MRRTCSLIISFIQGWFVSLLKEDLNNYDFLIKSNSGLEVIPSPAPALLLYWSNMLRIQTSILKFLFMYLDMNSNYFILLFCWQQSSYPWGQFCGRWRIHRHFVHSLSLHFVSVSVLKRFPFLCNCDLQRTKGEGLLYLLDSRGGGGQGQKTAVSRIPSPSVYSSLVLHNILSYFWQAIFFFLC